jgi:hypothetical protein
MMARRGRASVCVEPTPNRRGSNPRRNLCHDRRRRRGEEGRRQVYVARDFWDITSCQPATFETISGRIRFPLQERSALGIEDEERTTKALSGIVGKRLIIGTHS